MKKVLLLHIPLSFTFLLLFFAASAQNLIVNPSAEQVPTSNGWTAEQTEGTTGEDCYGNEGWHILGNQQGFPAAQDGTYLFFRVVAVPAMVSSMNCTKTLMYLPMPPPLMRVNI